jgi:hypothetical protein
MCKRRHGSGDGRRVTTESHAGWGRRAVTGDAGPAGVRQPSGLPGGSGLDGASVLAERDGWQALRRLAAWSTDPDTGWAVDSLTGIKTGGFGRPRHGSPEPGELFWFLYGERDEILERQAGGRLSSDSMLFATRAMDLRGADGKPVRSKATLRRTLALVAEQKQREARKREAARLLPRMPAFGNA